MKHKSIKSNELNCEQECDGIHYLQIIEQFFDLKAIDTYCRIGYRCIGFTNDLKNHYPWIEYRNINILKLKKNEGDSDEIKDSEHHDLSQIKENRLKYDLVSCSDVIDHLSLNERLALLSYLRNISRDLLIIFSSNQNLNSGCITFFNNSDNRRVEIIESEFDIWLEATLFLRAKADQNHKFNNQNFRSIKPTVYRRKRFQTLHSKRFVQGTSTDNPVFDLDKTYQGLSIQRQVILMRDNILFNVKEGLPLSILRFGDGDLYFINAIPKGSAKPGARALRINYSNKNNFLESRIGLYQVDYVTAEINSMMEGGLRFMMLLEFFYQYLDNFHKMKIWNSKFFIHIINIFLKTFCVGFRSYGLRLLAYPLLAYQRFRLNLSPASFPILNPFQYSFEAVYALIASRIIFRMFPSEILIVGQTEKLNAIRELVKYKQYREYLGIKNFCGYVGVEKIGAADHEELILDALKSECKRTNPKIILVGIGSAKLYVIPRIRLFSNAVVIDVGAGIDALAGVISQDRPYFADWINYKSKNIDYSSMDLMDADNPNRDCDRYKKVIL